MVVFTHRRWIRKDVLPLGGCCGCPCYCCEKALGWYLQPAKGDGQKDLVEDYDHCTGRVCLLYEIPGLLRPGLTSSSTGAEALKRVLCLLPTDDYDSWMDLIPLHILHPLIYILSVPAFHTPPIEVQRDALYLLHGATTHSKISY